MFGRGEEELWKGIREKTKNVQTVKEQLTIPPILSKIHVFRPSLSESGAQAVVTMILSTDNMTVKRAADEGKRAERMLTPVVA